MINRKIGESGMNKLGVYNGYRTDVNPSITNVFATSAFRFGHSLINPIIRRLDENKVCNNYEIIVSYFNIATTAATRPFDAT